MSDLDIRLSSNDLPEVLVEQRLFSDLAIREVNNSHLRAGLAAGGVEAQAIDTLLVNFQRGPRLSIADVSYDRRRHSLDVAIGRGKPGTWERIYGEWANLPPSLSRTINYGIALQVPQMVELAQCHPDTLVRARHSEREITPAGAWWQGALTSVGATAGALVAELVDKPILVGGAIGASAVIVGEGIVSIARSRSDSRIDDYGAIDKAETAIRIRAAMFAESKEMFELFKGVVQMELLPKQKA